VTSKKGFMCFSANVGHHFLNSNNVGHHFFNSNNVGRHFCPDFQGFFPDFNKSKLLGYAFNPCTLASYTTAPGKPSFGPCLEKILPAPIFRSTCSSTEMLKGYMARESLGTPVIDDIIPGLL